MVTVRKKIGIVFKNNPQWTGGVYYILNLIRSLKYLPEQDQPVIYLFCWSKNDFDKVQLETNYSFLKLQLVPQKIQYNFVERLFNYAGRMILKKNIFEKCFNEKIELIFPYTYDYYFDLIANKVFWLPDFQDRYLPQFFTQEELTARRRYQELLATGRKKIVFSSDDARNDFQKFCPNNDAQIYTLKFASVNELNTTGQNMHSVREKYTLPEVFFYAPNQFWAHKNHVAVIEAVDQIVKSGGKVSVYFSGNENDYRNPGFIFELKKMVTEKKLDSYIHFLGFIDREDVFKLMQLARAVIQPSLFEGWSTVVEDAKSVNAYVVASDINVHREQLKFNASFFSPHDVKQLAGLLNNLIENAPHKQPLDYDQNISTYACDILGMTRFFN